MAAEKAPSSKAIRVLDPLHSEADVVLYRRFFSTSEADALFQAVQRESPWEDERIGGYLAKRKTCGMARQAGTTYTYSGKTQVAHALAPSVAQIMERVESHTGQLYSYVYLNRYPDESAGIDWHGDDEEDLKPRGWIASVSLGEARWFKFRRVYKASEFPEALRTYYDWIGDHGLDTRITSIPRSSDVRVQIRVNLPHGSLLIMKGDTQRYWQHSLPAVKPPKPNTERINLTFRQLRDQQEEEE